MKLFSKKRGLLVTLTLALTLPVSGMNAFASEAQSTEIELNAVSLNDNTVQIKKLDPSLSILKFSDGRVKGVENGASLNKEQKRKILVEMRFSDKEIDAMPEDLVADLIKTGGVKVDLQSTATTEEYHSLDGQTYSLTDDNKGFVEGIRKADINQIMKESGLKSPYLQTRGEVDEIGLKAYHGLLYNGKTANAQEFMYSYLTYYKLGSFATLPGIDKVGTSWKNEANRTGATAYIYFAENLYETHSVDVSSVYGSSTSLSGSAYRGYMKNDINVSINMKGNTTTFASKYAHPYTVLTPSVSIGALGVSFSSFIGATYSWSSDFTVGNVSINY